MKARKVTVTVPVETDVDVTIDIEDILEDVDDDVLIEALVERGFTVLDSGEYAEDRISFDEMTLAIIALEADLKAQKVAAKDIKLYIKPQDGACYYVADGKVAGRVDLF